MIWTRTSVNDVLLNEMAPGKRAVAFSAKAKKKQLQNKREEKRSTQNDAGDFLDKRMIYKYRYAIIRM